MSIENLIQENTAALKDLAAAIRSIVMVTPPAEAYSQPAANEVAPAETKPAKEPKAKKQPDHAPSAEATTASQLESAAPTASEEPPAEPATSPAVTYDDVAAAVKQLAVTKGRDAAVALLAEFGASNAKQLPEDQWAAFVAKAAA